MTTTELVFFLLLFSICAIAVIWIVVYEDRKKRGDFDIVSNELENSGITNLYESYSRKEQNMASERKEWFIRKITYRSGRVEYKKTVINR